MSAEKPSFLPLQSFFYPYRGFRFLLRHPRLLSYVAIPVGINTVLYGLFMWLAVAQLGPLVERYVPRGEAWYWGVLFYLLATLFGLFLALVVIYTFTLVGNLILAPFNDLLSEKVERLYTGREVQEPFSLRALLKDMGRAFKAELGRLALFTGVLVFLLALNLIPGIGTLVSGAGLTVVTLYFLGWEYLDYSMERWHFAFRAKRRTAAGNLLVFLAFGSGSALLLLIPLANLFAIPVCVVGATLLFCDLRQANRLPAEATPAAGAASREPAPRP